MNCMLLMHVHSSFLPSAASLHGSLYINSDVFFSNASCSLKYSYSGGLSVGWTILKGPPCTNFLTKNIILPTFWPDAQVIIREKVKFVPPMLQHKSLHCYRTHFTFAMIMTRASGRNVGKTIFFVKKLVQWDPFYKVHLVIL